MPSAQAFLPEVFERWDELRTFDVCQEPLPGEDDRKEPPPVTQLFGTRAEAADVDWQTVTLAELAHGDRTGTGEVQAVRRPGKVSRSGLARDESGRLSSARAIGGKSRTDRRPAATSADPAAASNTSSSRPRWAATTGNVSEVAWSRPAAIARRVPTSGR